MKQRLAMLGVKAAFQTVGRVAPGPAARIAEELFCHPPRAPLRPQEQEFLASGGSFQIATSVGPLAAWAWGAGPTVVLVHGWGSRAGRFRVIAPLLATHGFRVVAYDGPAHGDSPGHRTSLPEYSAALLEVASALGPLRAAVGHSLGGAAVAVALARGLSLARAVLIAPFAAPPDFLDQYARRVMLTDAVRERVKASLETRLGIRMNELHIPGIAARLRTPALLIHDRDDEDIPLSDGEAIADAWAGSELVVTHGLGHHAIMRDAAVAQRIAAFLSQAIDQ